MVFIFCNGIYPVAPVTMQYVIGSPLFNSIEIALPNGNNLKIESKNNNKNNVYINSLKYNDTKYSQNWLDHRDLVKGGAIKFQMSDQPNYDWGSTEKDIPYSMSKK